MKRIILALAVVGLAGGVASADRWHGGGGGRGEFHGRGELHGGGGGQVVVRDHRWEGGVHVSPSYRGNYRYERPVYNNSYRYNVVRRPIYVERPIIRQRYYDYRYRPEVIVENYGARDGYYWVNGAWQWNGYEWIWQPGHYEPDPNWVAPSSYYDQSSYYQQPTYVDPSVSVGVGVGY
ncbi:MAG: hypothetical protein JO257_13285 [Deltaproteobacteria bacterium]|nr:hypothetical protein [Deltaproteobacteria bacterium]